MLICFDGLFAGIERRLKSTAKNEVPLFLGLLERGMCVVVAEPSGVFIHLGST